MTRAREMRVDTRCLPEAISDAVFLMNIIAGDAWKQSQFDSQNGSVKLCPIFAVWTLLSSYLLLLHIIL